MLFRSVQAGPVLAAFGMTRAGGVSLACTRHPFAHSLTSMSSRFLTPLAEALPSTVPFTGPETLERRQGHPFRARLGANESLFGPSPKAITAMQEAAAEVWKYGDPESHDLN